MRLLNCQPVCFVCRRRSSGFAVGAGKSLGWFCEECGPKLAKRVFAMGTKAFDTYEHQALDLASPGVGEHLEKLGKTDFALFSEQEWFDFLALVVNEFGDGMRKACAELEPPF